MGGHATHDEQEARQVLPPDLFAAWGKRDPVGLYEEHLIVSKIATRAELGRMEEVVREEVERGAAEALKSRDGHLLPPESALGGVYADHTAADSGR